MIIVYAIIITTLVQGQHVSYVADYADSKQECQIGAAAYQRLFPGAVVRCVEKRVW